MVSRMATNKEAPPELRKWSHIGLRQRQQVSMKPSPRKALHWFHHPIGYLYQCQRLISVSVDTSRSQNLLISHDRYRGTWKENALGCLRFLEKSNWFPNAHDENQPFWCLVRTRSRSVTPVSTKKVSGTVVILDVRRQRSSLRMRPNNR